MKDEKTYQEIPIDLFKWCIEKYKGIREKEYGVDIYGLIKFGDQPILISRKDWGGCHPSYPFTSFSIHDYSLDIFDVIKNGFRDLPEAELEKKVIMKGSSIRVSQGRLNTIYDFIYESPNKKEKISMFLRNFMKDVKIKTEEMLSSGEYTIHPGYSAEEFRKWIGLESTNPTYLFMKHVETNHKERIYEEKWRKIQK